jgi:sporulation protein YlmC with PRC-barrel domain
VDLVRDLLDKKVVDRNGREMGRVDGIVLERREAGAPRVAAIEIGPSVLAERIHPFLGRCVAALERVFGVDEGRPVRIPLSSVLAFEPHVKVDVAFGETAVSTVEQRLRRLISRVPASS